MPGAEELLQRRAYCLRIAASAYQNGPADERPMIPAFERELEHARQLGKGRFEEEARSFLATARTFGPTPAQDAIDYCKRQLTEMSDLVFEINTLRRLASLYAMQGSIEQARERLDKNRDFLSEAGLDAPAAAARMAEARVEWYAGERFTCSTSSHVISFVAWPTRKGLLSAPASGQNRVLRKRLPRRPR
jgi:hypothetical protein